MKSSFLIPEQGSTMASQVDGIAFCLLILSLLILALVFGLIIGLSVIYRKGSPRSREIKQGKGMIVELGWTVVTLFAFLGLFAWAAIVFFQMHVPPPGASEITVTGQQWMWKFQHPNGKREIDELHVPIGEPILLTMTSQDVIHSFFVPDFRIKQDVLPGRYTRMWFQASLLGEHHLFCTQYCGTMHAGMRGKMVVMSKEDYQQWLQTGTSQIREEGGSSATRGSRLFTRMGCMSCHGVQSGVKAPNLNGIFGRTIGLSDGTQVIADENYIRESILNPNAKISQGYDPIMPTFTGLLNEDEVLDLIAYIKSLSGTSQGNSPSGPPDSTAIPSPPPSKEIY